jgi:hypothetical protein
MLMLLLLLLLPFSCFAAIEFELHYAVSETLPVNLPSATANSTTNKAAFQVPAGLINLGVYFIDLSLGSEGITAKAIIDTGSGLIHVPCHAVSGWTGESHDQSHVL